MQPSARGALNRPHGIAADVANHDLRPRSAIAVPRREPIDDLRAVLRARSPERLLPQAAPAKWRLTVFVRDRRLERIHQRRYRAFIELLARRDVTDLDH